MKTENRKSSIGNNRNRICKILASAFNFENDWMIYNKVRTATSMGRMAILALMIPLVSDPCFGDEDSLILSLREMKNPDGDMIVQKIEDGRMAFGVMDMTLSPITADRIFRETTRDLHNTARLIKLHGEWKTVDRILSNCLGRTGDWCELSHSVQVAIAINNTAGKILGFRYMDIACQSGNFEFVSALVLPLKSIDKEFYYEKIKTKSKMLEKVIATQGFVHELMKGSSANVFFILSAYLDSEPEGKAFYDDIAPVVKSCMESEWKNLDDAFGVLPVAKKLIERAETQKRTVNSKPGKR